MLILFYNDVDYEIFQSPNLIFLFFLFLLGRTRMRRPSDDRASPLVCARVELC